MVVLKALGRFFARIGRWIRDTAWVQPLLIVGAIFGLIFSIPYIVNGVGSWFKSDDNAADKWYANYKYSLVGAEKGTSQVDKLFDAIQDGKANEFVGAERFFLSFVKEGNSTCAEQYEGYKRLTSSWGKGEFADLKDQKFKMVTIFIDTEKEIDGEQKNLFKYVWENHPYLFENFTENYEDSQYAQYKNYTANCTSFSNLFDADEDGHFKVEAPSTFYFDFASEKSSWSWNGNKINGLSEIMFSIPGDSEFDRARTFHDCWTHTGVFADHNYYAD